MDNSILELSDFSFVCRICLEKQEKLISIFTEILHLDEKSYREMLEECASVNISEDDSLPKNVCLQCSKHLEQSYKLKIQCLSSEKRLQSVLENVQRTVKIEEPFSQNDYEIYDDDNKEEDDFNLYESKNNYSEAQVEIIVKEEVTDDFTDNSSNSKKSSKIVNYKCTDCEAQFTCANKLFDHNKDYHFKSVVQCEFCKTDFESGSYLQTHCSESSVCKWCTKDFNCISNLIKHNQVHNVCTTCGKTFNTAENCWRHMQIHKEKGHLCTHCGKLFIDKRDLISHVRTHTGEKPYKCKICASKFHDNRNLTLHMTKHSTERKYECDICNATYKWKNSLNQHKLSQHSNVVFSCNYCDTRCSSKRNLQRHQLTHSGKPRGEWNLVCTYCNKLCNRKDNLKVHLRTHTGEKPYVCSKCGRGFSAKHVMTGHMKTCNIKNNII